MALTQAARVQMLHMLALNGISKGKDLISVPLGGSIKLTLEMQVHVHVKPCKTTSG